MYKYLSLALLLILPSAAFAAGYIQLEPLPYLSGTDIKFPELMRAFFQICMVGGAVLAVLMITLGGVQYMTSDVLGMKEAGRSRMKNAAYGLLLLLSIWVILNTINPALLNFSLNIGATESTPLSLPTNIGGPSAQTGAPPQMSPVQNTDGTPVTRPDGSVVSAPATFGNSGYYFRYPDGTFEFFRSGQSELNLCNQIREAQQVTATCQPWSR